MIRLSREEFSDENGELFLAYSSTVIRVDVLGEFSHLTLRRHNINETFFVELLQHLSQFSTLQSPIFVVIPLQKYVVNYSCDSL